MCFRVRLYRNACISLQVWASGLRASVSGNQFYLRVSDLRQNFGAEFSRGHSHPGAHICFGEIRQRCCLSSLLLGNPGTIASEGSDIPRELRIRVDRLCQVRNSVQGQSVFLRQRQGKKGQSGTNHQFSSYQIRGPYPPHQ